VEVFVRNKLLLMAAIVLATTGTATGVTAASSAVAASGPCGTAAAPHTYQHVVWIWMENHSFSDIIGHRSQAPYINSLAASCGLATDYHNTTHPSLPNYLAATSGLAQGRLPILSFLDGTAMSR
jgi:phosphatidylinositol-3-phosphatase